MPDNCVAHYPSLGEVPHGIITYLITVILIIPIRWYLVYLKYSDIPGDTLPSSPSYGVAALPILMLVSGIALALNGPNLLLWFIFRNAPGSNAAEFACQCQNSIVGGITGLYLTFLTATILRANQWRHKNKDIFAANISNHLLPTSKESTTRMAIIPCFRGMWIPPLIEKLKSNVGTRGDVEVYCCDNYESKFNSETNDWMRINMHLEGHQQHIQLYSKLNYDKLPFKDCSLDYFIMPVGNLNIYFTSIEDEELQNQAYVQFFTEVNRVLRPGGKFIATVTTVLFKNPWFDTSLMRGLFEVVPAPTLWIWNTFVPSTIAVLQKPNGADNDAEIGDGAALNSAWLPSVSFIRLIEDTIPVVKDDRLSSSYMGKQWVWAYTLTALMVLLWVIAVILTWAFLAELQVPTFLPYGSMVSAVFISNWLTLPIVMYFLFFKMVEAAESPAQRDDVCSDNNDQQHTEAQQETTSVQVPTDDTLKGDTLSVAGNTTGGRRLLSSKQASYISVHKQAIEEEAASRRVRRAFLDGMLEVFMLLTLISVIGWLPYFAMDLILAHRGYTAFELQDINQYVGYGITGFVLLVLRPTYRWYLARKKVAAAAEAAAAAADAEEIQQVVRASLSAWEHDSNMEMPTQQRPAVQHSIRADSVANPLNKSFREE